MYLVPREATLALDGAAGAYSGATRMCYDSIYDIHRVCPGLYIGERSIFIIFARLLWALDFGYALDAQGKEIPIDENDFTSGFR